MAHPFACPCAVREVVPGFTAYHRILDRLRADTLLLSFPLVQGFCNPSNFSFTYPATTGISYSFTDTGFFEEAQYRFTANASNPRCITAFILWQHGTYQLNNNGSLTLYPFSADGRIQVQDPCAAVTNIITYYDQITLYADWGIILDSVSGNYQLNLNAFDGSKMPPLYLKANPPNMLPTTVLTGANATGQYTKRDDSMLVAAQEKREPPRLLRWLF